MSKLQWSLLTISGILFVLSVNIWAAKRDHKFRFGKFDPIPYPLINNQNNEIKPKKDTE